jgi:putative flippase GtrA
MKKVHHHTKSLILTVVDAFYPLFKGIMPLQTFRYAACGGFNTLMGIALYHIGFTYIFKKQIVHVWNFALEPHIAADYLFAIWISFPIGFYLSRYVVFQESNLSRRVQVFRYGVVVFGAMGINYFFLKFFVEIIKLDATLAKVCTNVIVIIFSYISQRNYSFKQDKQSL